MTAHPEPEEQLIAELTRLRGEAAALAADLEKVQTESDEQHRENERLRASLAEAKDITLDVQRALAETEQDRENWKAAAIGLGVNGKAERDSRRKLLTLSMRVDEGVLRLGGSDVLTATFRDMRDQCKRAIAQRSIAAAALHTAEDTP